jgi:hypothetical protein
MAVCEYCKATILKDAESVRDIGKMSAVLEDYSPIQIGTSGVYGSQGFTVIGRIQLKYPAGMWNEWYVMFDDGRNAWLGDASGQYMLTIEKQVEGELPSAVLLAPSREFAIDGKRYTVADVRTAQCIGGQGELPFRVGEGWQARLADMRSGTSFLTLDYSESERPIVYSGQAVTLENLKCQLLRDDEQIKESAGRYRGKASPLDCPSCGSSVSFIPGATTHIVCPSCRAQLDTTGSVAEVIAAGRAMEQIHTTLELGAKATVSGKQYDLIGVMSRRDDEGEGWTEYLMYNARAGFFWLVETSEGWFRADVQDNWPRWSGSTASLGNINFTKLYEYEAEVTYAAGAFNWRVSAGDKVKVVEFESDHNTLAAEITGEELTWSMSGPVSADQVKAWFGKSVPQGVVSLDDNRGLSDLAVKFLKGLLVVNAIPLLLAFGGTWYYMLIAAAAIYFPALYLESSKGSAK